MATIITIANQKGGVAKTTTANAMAEILKSKNYKVLAIDLDPQANLTDSIGGNQNTNTIYNVFKNQVEIKDIIQNYKEFDLIPSNIYLSSADLEFTQTGREFMLKEALKDVQNDYDYIIIDTPPSLNNMTVNAFSCSHEIIIPITAGIFAVNGVSQLYKNIEIIKKYCNPGLKIAGLLITKYNSRLKLSQEVKELSENIAKEINTKVFKTNIRISVGVEEAQASKMPLNKYDNKNNVSKDYMDFINEYLIEK